MLCVGGVDFAGSLSHSIFTDKRYREGLYGYGFNRYAISQLAKGILLCALNNL